MRNVTHELIGVSAAVGAATTAELTTVETTAAAVAAFHGSWLPDVDQLGSRVHRRSRLERRSVVVGAAGALLRLPLIAFGAIASHRRVTHSALATAATTLLVWVALTPFAPTIAFVVAGGVGVGYAAHVLADACTPAGVWLWWPLSRHRVWLLPPRVRIATGSFREALVALAVIGTTVAVAMA